MHVTISAQIYSLNLTTIGRRNMSTTIFPDPYIIKPRAEHKHTIIALHGLGSTGPVFADRLLYGAPYSETPDRVLSNRHEWQRPVKWTDDLPMKSIKWIFPTAPVRKVGFPQNRECPAWFRISSIDDLEHEQEFQQDGLRESVDNLVELVSSEVELMKQNGGSGKDVILWGRSQASSVVGWSVLSGRLPEVGGVILSGSWLIYARALAFLQREITGRDSIKGGAGEVTVEALEFVKSMYVWAQERRDCDDCIPVFMGHSKDDQWISVEKGRQFADVFLASRYPKLFRQEFEGAEEEGHWFKDPEEFDAILDFLIAHMRHGDWWPETW